MNIAVHNQDEPGRKYKTMRPLKKATLPKPRVPKPTSADDFGSKEHSATASGSTSSASANVPVPMSAEEVQAEQFFNNKMILELKKSEKLGNEQGEHIQLLLAELDKEDPQDRQVKQASDALSERISALMNQHEILLKLQEDKHNEKQKHMRMLHATASTPAQNPINNEPEPSKEEPSKEEPVAEDYAEVLPIIATNLTSSSRSSSSIGSSGGSGGSSSFVVVAEVLPCEAVDTAGPIAPSSAPPENWPSWAVDGDAEIGDDWGAWT